MFDQNGQMYPC